MFKYLEHKEKYFFYSALVLITVLYLLSGFNKHSDGVFHLQSAEIIKYLLTNTCPDAAKIFKLNPMIVPNWASASIMVTLLLLGIPSIIVHKITFCLAFIIIILGFRYLISKSKGNIILSWLGIGFAFNSLVLMGTYNTAFSLGLIFFSIGYYEENKNNIQSIKFNIIFCILITCAWFSHFVVYFVGGLIIFCYEINALILYLKNNGFNISNLSKFIRPRLLLILCFIPSLILSVNYLIHDKQTFNFIQEKNTFDLLVSHFSNFILLDDFFVIRLPSKYLATNYILKNLSFIFVICITTYLYIYPKNKRKIYTHPIFLALIFVLILSFAVANGIGGSWQLSWRLRIIAWYLVFFLLSHYMQKNRIVSSTIIIFSIIYCSVSLLNLFYQSHYESYTARKILSSIPNIQPNSNVYTLRLDESKRINSIIESLTNNKNCIIEINNYQANYNYFPIIVQKSQINLPNFYPLYDKDVSRHFLSIKMTNINIDEYKTDTGIDTDYIFIWGDKSVFNTINEPTRKNYINRNIFKFEHDFFGYLEKNMQPIFSYKDRDGKYFFRIYKRLPEYNHKYGYSRLKHEAK